MPTSFSSALRTSRFNDIPSLIDFRTASCLYRLKGLELFLDIFLTLRYS